MTLSEEDIEDIKYLIAELKEALLKGEDYHFVVAAAYGRLARIFGTEELEK